MLLIEMENPEAGVSWGEGRESKFLFYVCEFCNIYMTYEWRPQVTVGYVSGFLWNGQGWR